VICTNINAGVYRLEVTVVYQHSVTHTVVFKLVKILEYDSYFMNHFHFPKFLGCFQPILPDGALHDDLNLLRRLEFALFL